MRRAIARRDFMQSAAIGQYGLPERERHGAGRAELLATPFATCGRALGPGGFDPARAIRGIAVNRWPRGYAPECNAPVDGDTRPERMPNVIGRTRFGRIAIADSDAGMDARADVAIEQPRRAVRGPVG